jgi:hypothetical protein
VIDDITGITGLAILVAIVAGERDPASGFCAGGLGCRWTLAFVFQIAGNGCAKKRGVLGSA